MADMNILWVPQVAVVVKNPPATAGNTGLIPLFRKLPWKRKWQPTPVFLPGESCRQRTDGLLSIGSQRIGHSASLIAQLVKNLTSMLETWVQHLGCEDPLETEMATHSSILAWKIPRTEEPGRLQ